MKFNALELLGKFAFICQNRRLDKKYVEGIEDSIILLRSATVNQEQTKYAVQCIDCSQRCHDRCEKFDIKTDDYDFCSFGSPRN